MIGTAMRLDPRYTHEYLYWLGLAQFGMGRFDEAAVSLTRASRADPDDERALILLAATYGHLDRLEEAESAIEQGQRRCAPTGSRICTRDRFGRASMSSSLAHIPSTTWICGRSRSRRIVSGCARAFALAGVPEGGQEGEVSPTEIAGAATVDAAAAKMLFDRGVPFVDVRGDSDWSIGHIPGAIHLDLDRSIRRGEPQRCGGQRSAGRHLLHGSKVLALISGMCAGGVVGLHAGLLFP